MYEPLWKLGVHRGKPPLEGSFLVSLVISMKSYVLDSESDQLLAPPYIFPTHHLESSFTSKLIYNGDDNTN